MNVLAEGRMASLGELGRLTEAEFTDLSDRVDRFQASWKRDRPADIAAHLPPAGARHRGHVLVELLKTEMELRVRAGLPVRVETYLARFSAEFPPDTVPLSLISEEYRLRHRYGDKPALDEYRVRFPDLYPQLAAVFREVAQTVTPWLNIGPIPKGEMLTPSIGAAEPTRVTDEAPPTRVPASAAPKMKAKSETISAVGGLVPGGEVLPAEFRYKLIRRIGVGAFGEVYEAEAPGGFRVAVKRILRSVDHPASKGEVASLEALKAIAHPFLLQTQAYWVFEDRLVIVMELAEGSLSDRIETYKARGLPGVPPEELIPFFEQAAEALDYLHSQNISHRDVKPPNLLTLRGYAKVADFGLARGHEHTMTNVGMEVGTPLYMAPEVWRQKVSLQSDQYSLAASYVQARLGRPVFSARTMPELCFQHMEERPDLAPLPEAERKVLIRALAKKPDDRFPTCAAFTKALRKSVLEPDPPPSQVVPRLEPSRWGTLAMAVTAALVCGLTVGGVIYYLRPPTPQPDQREPIPVAKRLWVPTGWEPADREKTVVLPGGQEYFERLTRTVAGEKLIAILIAPTSPGDPSAFYMLENKITNQVFATEWDRADKNPSSALNQLRRRAGDQASVLLPEEWRKGAIDQETTTEDKVAYRGITGEMAGVPVVAVTFPEAMMVADALGGLVPTKKQWIKATGASEGNGDGPAGPAEDEKDGLADIHRRQLALAQSAPWPVARRTNDVSVFGIHQLVSNGYEWTRDMAGGLPLDQIEETRLTPTMSIVSNGWEMKRILTYKRILESTPGAEWTRTGQMAGFRIVLEPK